MKLRKMYWATSKSICSPVVLANVQHTRDDIPVGDTSEGFGRLITSPSDSVSDSESKRPKPVMGRNPSLSCGDLQLCYLHCDIYVPSWTWRNHRLMSLYSGLE